MRTINKNKRGVTLMELVVTILITAIIVAAISVLFVDTHRGWLDSYAKIHGGAAADAAMSQAAFERVVRKASRSKYELNGLQELTVYYYADWQNSSELDRYARFYRSDNHPEELYVEHGQFDASDSTVISRMRLASTVSDLEFKPTSGGIEMKLLLDDGRESTTLVATAILHNE